MNFASLNAHLNRPVQQPGATAPPPQAEKPKLSLQGIVSKNFKTEYLQYSLSYKAEDAASCIAAYSCPDLIRELGLENLTEEQVLSAKSLPPGCTQLVNIAPLLTKEQWKALPRAHFFLCAPHLWDYWIQSSAGDSIQPTLYMNEQEFSNLYLDRDPDLTAFFALGEDKKFHSSLLGKFLAKSGPASGEVRVVQNIRALPPKSLDLLVKRTFPNTPWVDERSLSQILPLEKVEQLSLDSLVLLYPSSLAVKFLSKPENSPLKEAIKRGFARFSPADIAGHPDLQDLTNPKAVAFARSFLPLVNEAQWRGLPQPLFLLFVEASSYSREREIQPGYTSRELVGIELGIDTKTFREIYESQNIPSSRLVDLIFGERGGKAILAARLVPFRPEDVRALSSKIDTIPAADEKNRQEGKEIKSLLWQSASRFSVADLVAAIGNPTETAALSSDLPAFAKAAAPFLTEAQWRELPLPAFLLFARATSDWKEYESGGSGHTAYKLVPVGLTITNATLREIYASHNISPVVLADLVLDKKGPGVIFLERLMPLEGEAGKVLLGKMQTLSVSADNSKIDSLITKSLSAEEVRTLGKDEFSTAVRLWDQEGRPKIGEPNFNAWLERAIEEKNNTALSLLSSIEDQEKPSWSLFLNRATPEFLWALFTSVCTLNDQEQKFNRLQTLCGSLSTSQWDAMLEKATSDSLISLFENTCLPSKTDTDRMKISPALAKLRALPIPIDSQKKILTMFVYTDPCDQIEPLWGTFVKNKSDASLSEFWKDLLEKAKTYSS